MGAADLGLLDAAIDERLSRFLDGVGTAEDTEAVRIYLSRARSAPELRRHVQQIFGLDSRRLMRDRMKKREQALRDAYREFCREIRRAGSIEAFAAEFEKFMGHEWICWAGDSPPSHATQLQRLLFGASLLNHGRAPSARHLRRVIGSGK